MVELSSLDVFFLARELQTLQDAYIDKVYEVEPGTFLFRMRHPERGRAALLVRPGAYVAMAAEAPETPQSPTSFATVLRRHLPGLRIRRIEQHGFDRVLVFHLDQHGEAARLVVELFGKGNLVLVGPDGLTKVAQRTETFKDRTIKRDEPFKFPPARTNPLTLARADFHGLAERSARDVVRFLATDAAFGPDLAEELVHRANVAKDRKASGLTESEQDALWKAWVGLRDGEASPVIATRDAAVRVESVPLSSPKFAAWVREPVPALSEAIRRAAQQEAAARPVVPDAETERLRRQIEHQEQAIQDLDKDAAEWESKGRALYETYVEAQRALHATKEALAQHGWSGLAAAVKTAKLDGTIERVVPDARRVHVRAGGATFVLDPSQSLEANASEIFQEAKRVRAKAASARAAVAEARTRLAGATKPRKAAPEKRKAPEKRFWFESFRWFYTTEGFLVVGGRDAGTNEKLVKKHLSSGDLYFHADVHGAPSCVLKGEGRTPGEASLREAAQFGASYSRAFSQFGSSDAYWVKPEQVSKTAPTGEFVAKGSFVIRGQRNYIPALPMEIGVGLVRLAKDGRPVDEGAFQRLMGGPPVAVQAHSKRWVVLVRGDQKPAPILKELAPFFGVTADEVQGVLPSSTLRVDKKSEAAP